MSKPEDNHKLTEYTLEDGAYGLYFSADGHCVDDDKIGSHFYRKEQVDALVKSMQKRIKKINKRLKDSRRKYKETASLLAWRTAKIEEALQ